MDDLTAMTAKEIGMRWILKRLDVLAAWGKLTFKPRKSRSLLIKRGKVSKARFKVQGELIPMLSENPIRALGKVFDDSLTNAQQFKDTMAKLITWLKAIDKSQIPGNLKVWCFEFGILPRLSWPFSLYPFPLTFVETMERKASRFLRKWLGVPHFFSSVNLYSKSTPASLSVGSIVEEYKVN